LDVVRKQLFAEVPLLTVWPLGPPDCSPQLVWPAGRWRVRGVRFQKRKLAPVLN
jgi:hypothetical protein